jgi:hypothetical protein
LTAFISSSACSTIFTADPADFIFIVEAAAADFFEAFFATVCRAFDDALVLVAVFVPVVERLAREVFARLTAMLTSSEE